LFDETILKPRLSAAPESFMVEYCSSPFLESVPH
jgi:hypothetical protein